LGRAHRPAQFGDALRLLAVALEQQLPRFRMVDKIGNPQDYQAFLPRLKTLLRDSGILLVLDNLETLLTENGTWRDTRWEPLIATLTGHGGQTRTILTSRIVPVGLEALQVLPVHALSRDETLLLARELPHLRALLESTDVGLSGPLRADTDTEAEADQQGDGQSVLAGRELALATLELVQGHPKMLELADAAAGTDPTALAAAVSAARTALPGARLQAFLSTGTTALDGEQLFTALTVWTTTAAINLPDASRLLLQVLCYVEEPDRDSPTLEGNWADIWQRLQLDGEPPPLAEALTPLLRSALVAAETLAPTTPDPDGDKGLARYRIHPGIAQTINATTPPEVATAVDTELAAWFTTLARDAVEQAHAGHNTTTAVVYAGIHAVPYLLRLHDWDTASRLLEQARHADQANPVTLQAVLPPLERIATITGAAKDTGVLAAALRTVDPARAETLLHQTYTNAVQNDDHRGASVTAGELITLYRDTGRAREALRLVEQKIQHTRAAGLGPWTQLGEKAVSLQILARLGQHQDVLDQLPRLLKTMKGLPDQPGANESITPWNVRELLYDIGRNSASALRRWQEALDYNAKTLSSMQRRGATAHELAHSRCNDAGSLTHLGRYDDAEQVLRHCQQVFEHAGNTSGLGKVFTHRAILEMKRGHQMDAVRLQRQALRLDYVSADPDNVAGSHSNLASYLPRTGGDKAEQHAHRLAAALLYNVIGETHDAQDVLRALSVELHNSASTDDITDQGTPATSPMPTTLADVATLVEVTEGVHYTNLIAALTDPATADNTLTQIRLLAYWQPLIYATAAAATTGGPLPDEVIKLLDEHATTQDWKQLATAIRRILAGDRDPNTLLTGLDPVDTAILTAILKELPS
jgi:tetratricopeptide (TPR) repeat protein